MKTIECANCGAGFQRSRRRGKLPKYCSVKCYRTHGRRLNPKKYSTGFHFQGGNNVCQVDGCDRPYRCSGYCGLHYSRMLRNGTVDLQEKTRSDIGICPECKVTEFNPRQAKRCMDCYNAYRRENAKSSWKDSAGYVVLGRYWDHPNANSRGQLREHTKVMCDVLGRPLEPDENVHHINGVRDDNRPENLELWSSSQPAGQRIADKIEWAKELLSLYEPEALAEPMMLRVVS